MTHLQLLRPVGMSEPLRYCSILILHMSKHGHYHVNQLFYGLCTTHNKLHNLLQHITQCYCCCYTNINGILGHIPRTPLIVTILCEKLTITLQIQIKVKHFRLLLQINLLTITFKACIIRIKVKHTLISHSSSPNQQSNTCFILK